MNSVEALMLWKQGAADELLTPVSIDRLRRHFSRTCRLNDEQVGLW